MPAMTLRLAAAAALALAAVPSPASAALRGYGGATADGQPIVVGLDARSGRVDRMNVMFSAKCRSGKGYSFGHRLTRRPGQAAEPEPGQYPLAVKMRRGGRFTASAIVFERLSEDRLGGISITFTGRVRGNTVTGTLKAEVTVGPDQSGAEPEDTCAYSKKTFRARRAPRRILTGETSQSLPVVVELARGARSVKEIDIGWNAGCEPPGFIQIPDELINFRIRGGRFGDEFDHTVRLDDGTERVFHYDLDGRANRRRASGTMDIVMEDRGGSAPGTCRTGAVRWSAR
jgi:hypothetical protein